MDALQLVESLHPGALIRELAAGANRVFRVVASDGGSSIVTVGMGMVPKPSRNCNVGDDADIGSMRHPLRNRRHQRIFNLGPSEP